MTSTSFQSHAIIRPRRIGPGNRHLREKLCTRHREISPYRPFACTGRIYRRAVRLKAHVDSGIFFQVCRVCAVSVLAPLSGPDVAKTGLVGFFSLPLLQDRARCSFRPFRLGYDLNLISRSMWIRGESLGDIYTDNSKLTRSVRWGRIQGMSR